MKVKREFPHNKKNNKGVLKMKIKKNAAFAMASAMALTAVVPVFAAEPKRDETWFVHNETAGSESDMDVNLIVQESDVPVFFSAYVPSAMTIAVSRSGQVITPENLRIINGVETLPIDVLKM